MANGSLHSKLVTSVGGEKEDVIGFPQNVVPVSDTIGTAYMRKIPSLH